MKLIQKYRERKLKNLKQKMKKLKAEYKKFHDDKKYMNDYEYETVTDIIAGEMIRIRKKIYKLEDK